jgi:hypothetical protein
LLWPETCQAVRWSRSIGEHIGFIVILQTSGAEPNGPPSDPLSRPRGVLSPDEERWISRRKQCSKLDETNVTSSYKLIGKTLRKHLKNKYVIDWYLICYGFILRG